MANRYDDRYAGPRWTYGLTYRPLDPFHVPRDFIIWSDRPDPGFRHGRVDYPRQLTADELAGYQQTPVAGPDPCPLCDGAGAARSDSTPVYAVPCAACAGIGRRAAGERGDR